MTRREHWRRTVMNGLVGAVLAALSVAPTSCGPSKLTQLRLQAASDMRCRDDGIDIREVGGYTEYVSGCSHSDVYVWDHGQGRWVSLRVRAAFDLTCDVTGVQAGVLDSATFVAQGCGRRAVYKLMPFAGFVLDAALAPGPPR